MRSPEKNITGDVVQTLVASRVNVISRFVLSKSCLDYSIKIKDRGQR